MVAINVLAAAVALLLAGNGLYMLATPESWYQAVQSVLIVWMVGRNGGNHAQVDAAQSHR